MPAQRTIRSYPAPADAGASRDESQRDWEVVICGDLTDKQPDLIERLVSVPRRSRGTIYFDSCGGSTYTGLALASLIRLRGLRAIAVVAGECSSAALFPFAACGQRFVTEYSTLLFHPIRWQSDENVRLEEATEWARHFREMEPALDLLLSQMFDCSLDLLNEWTRPGRFVSGRELVEVGLAQMLNLTGDDLWQQMAR
ncbi:MAG: hypothetical protein DWQ41_00520 [Planctomycetota bacterium]|nr:MAG: hypothetical protein DWQ41_00520 [Planctomycetota bacterium]